MNLDRLQVHRKWEMLDEKTRIRPQISKGPIMIPRALLCLVLIRSVACGATYYVDNRAGSDAGDGRTQERALATIAWAVSLSNTSDTIVRNRSRAGGVFPEN